jgi:hypothetical protein
MRTVLVAAALALIAACSPSSSIDRASESVTAAPGPFSCGPLTCDGQTEFCRILEGGPAPVDGQPNVNYACEAIPQRCLGNVTCKCLPHFPPPGGCTETDGDFTVTILAP